MALRMLMETGCVTDEGTAGDEVLRGCEGCGVDGTVVPFVG